jgi:alanyl-tRNA synthetase
MRFDVIDTHKEGGFTLHLGHLREGKLTQGMKVHATVDIDRRQGIRRAHSATHILHYALQKHLGKHAQQQGSKVDRDWLRFDFTNPQAIGRETLDEIEADVNERITNAESVDWKTLPIAEARKAGAMMLFGEKYPDMVRMVSMGDFSKELCGGTHLTNTGQIGLFKIIGEESVSAGTRRVTALTGRAALERVRKMEAALHETAAALRSSVDDVPDRVAALVKEVRELKKAKAAAPRAGGASLDDLLASADTLGSSKLVVAEIPDGTADEMRQLIDALRSKAGSVAVMLGSHADGKVTLVAGISPDLEKKGLKAGDWIREPAKIVGGSGGGRPNMAQAGGKDPEKLSQALEKARAEMRAKLS